MPKANDVPVNVIIVEKRIRRLASISRRYLSNPRFVFAIGLFGVCSLFGILRTDLLRPLAQHDHSTYHPSFNWMSSALDWNSEDTAPAKAIDPNFEVNDYFQNDGLLVRKDRDRNVPDSELKTILMWNDAYGSRTYDIGHGREPFYKYKCPETRCYATSNRTYLKSVADFDALIIHQRGIDWKDMPKERKPHQRYIHWVMESAQYLYMDINNLNGLFNWTMTYKRNSDFFNPYGTVHQIRPHPQGEELEEYIREFGERNRHLAGNRTELKAAWFVSHCATQARREKYAKILSQHMDVDIYGKCGKFKCQREDESGCYKMMEEKYRFYLSFENSICSDYTTEKFFNILKYNVIPIVYGGTNLSTIAPPHSAINVFSFKTPKQVVHHLKMLMIDDAKFAEYFWWKDFYEVRTRVEDRAQPYCDLCKRLNDVHEPPKVYENMHKWWVTDSHCKRLKSSLFADWMG